MFLIQMGKNRLKRIADISEKAGIALFGLAVANSVFPVDSLSSNAKTVAAAALFGMFLVITSFFLTEEDGITVTSKKKGTK